MSECCVVTLVDGTECTMTGNIQPITSMTWHIASENEKETKEKETNEKDVDPIAANTLRYRNRTIDPEACYGPIKHKTFDDSTNDYMQRHPITPYNILDFMGIR